MANLRVPRELMLYFKNNHEIQRFFQKLENLLTGTGDTGLSDVEQRSTTAIGGKVSDIERRVSSLERENNRPSAIGKISELERRISSLETDNGKTAFSGKIAELERKIESLEKENR